MISVIKTDPVSGLQFKALQMNDESLIISNAFKGITRLYYDQENDAYILPARALDPIETLTALEASKILGTTKMFVSRLCSRGVLEYCKINGVLIITLDSVLKYKESRKEHDRTK